MKQSQDFVVHGSAIKASFAPWSIDPTHENVSKKNQSGTAAPTLQSIASSVVAVATGGITLDLIFDTAAMAAPASFRNGIEQAATILANTISDKITVNLNIDYSGTGGGAAAGPDSGYYESYSAIRSDLVDGEVAGDTTFNGLPSSSSIQGQTNVAVWNAQMKLFGLMGANDTTTDDGSAVFATDINPSLLVGVALHELTHALGRVPFGSAPDIFDLFRFSSPSVRLFNGGSTAPASYFSLDNGTTKLADYGRNSDPSDFLNSGVQGPNDPFNEYYTGGTTQALSNVDLEQIHALGFHIGSATSTPTPTPQADLTVSGLSVAGNRISFALNNIGAGPAGGFVSGLYLSKAKIPTTSDTLLAQFQTTTLQAGASQTQSIALSLPANIAAGTYYLSVITDIGSQVSESKETNNSSAAVQLIVGDSKANSLHGSSAVMFGLAGKDTIQSTGGNSVIIGGAGTDTLIGGTGNDQFVYTASNEGLDQIQNFHTGDLFDFAASGFGGNQALGGANTGVLDPSHFIASSKAPTSSAQDFWFNTANHTLYFGTGGQEIAMAHLQNNFVLHSSDIVLV